MSKEIVLALGGGGAKGHAHIGVIRVLERAGFKIRAMAGTSAGGLWGSFYAAGYDPDQIQAAMHSADRESLYTRHPDDGPAIMGLAGVEQLIKGVLGGKTFNDLRLPFAVTAVDINTAEEIVLQEGPVLEAVLATIAVPGIFPPRWLDGRLLIDGGILDPVPVAPARRLAPDLPVVAVVLSPPVDEWINPRPPRLLDSLPFLATYLARLRIAKALNIFVRSVDIGGAMLTDLRLRVDRPEVIIRPEVPHIGLLDDVDIDEVVRLGERAGERALPLLERSCSWQAHLRRRLGLDHRPYATGFRIL